MSTLNSSIFPNLSREHIVRLVLMGHVRINTAKVISYWRSTKKYSFKDYICLDRLYIASGVTHHARLFIRLEKSKATHVFIDLGTPDIVFMPSSGELTDRVFLDFFRWLISQPGVKNDGFQLRSVLKHHANRSLPIPYKPTGDIYMTGIKFGFSEKKQLVSLSIDRDKEDIIISLTSKACFHLDPKKFNKIFFDSVLEYVKRATPLLSKPRSIK